MKWLRLPYNVLQMFFLMFWCVFWISLAFVAALLSLNKDVPLVMARRIWAPPLIWASGAHFKLEPLPDVDWSKPHIFVMNHQSMLDIACAFAALPANLRFVAKKSLKYVPFLGWYMWLTQMIFVDRSNKKRAFKSLVEAGRRIREGASILVYPEGTRSRDGKILPFKTGSFALALEAQVPIVPVAIQGSLKVAPPGSIAFRPGPVRMKVGRPISTLNRARQEREALAQEVRQALIELHQEIGGAGEGALTELRATGNPA